MLLVRAVSLAVSLILLTAVSQRPKGVKRAADTALVHNTQPVDTALSSDDDSDEEGDGSRFGKRQFLGPSGAAQEAKPDAKATCCVS